MQFVERLRKLCGGKPVGFKLCLGKQDEFMGLCKAMIEIGIQVSRCPQKAERVRNFHDTTVNSFLDITGAMAPRIP